MRWWKVYRTEDLKDQGIYTLGERTKILTRES